MEKYIYIDQGSTYSGSFTTGVNLTGQTVIGQIRKWYDAAEYQYFSVNTTNAVAGIITVTMSAEQTSQLIPGRNVFDILMSDTATGTTNKRILQGQAVVSPGLSGVSPTNEVTVDSEELLTIAQGSTFSNVIELRNSNGSLKDLTGFTARMQIRPTVDSPIVIDNLTTENGKLSITGSIVSINISAATTASYMFDTAVFDLEIVAPDTVTVARVLSGRIVLITNITK